ncbi:MAG: hypothetical protein C0608_09860 [Deltaproteobacteria bacterium]|nr:MAG: hypothetical protein C0608_09860 [Deltaproteobacteria bacterium]
MVKKTKAPVSWWGEYEIPVDGFAKWEVGPLTLVTERKASEWRLIHWQSDNIAENRVSTVVSKTPPEIPEEAVDQRYAVDGTSPSITLTPMLPNRDVVSLPETPYSVLASEKVRIYVRTPIWVGVVSTKRKQQLFELPVYRMSDTWFGPDQMVGELCYASTTVCRTSLEDFPPWPHGVITPVYIKNSTDETLTVERIHIPAPNLSLFIDEKGGLWTQHVTIVLNKDSKNVEVNIGKKPPLEAGKTTLLAEARKKDAKSMLSKSLSALIGK